jgi:hypothetical protein
MKLSSIITLVGLYLTGTSSASTRSTNLVDQDAVITTTLTFYRSLDEKSEALMRSVTIKNLIFDGTLFADIGLGAPTPLSGQANIIPGLFASLRMTTMHNADHLHANVTAYVLAYHYKQLKDPRENPRNNYLIG